MAAHLSYGRVNLNVLREAVRRELREFLDKCAGSKVRDEARRHPGGPARRCEAWAATRPLLRDSPELPSSLEAPTPTALSTHVVGEDGVT